MDRRGALGEKRGMELLADSLACRRAGRRVFAHVSFRVKAGEAAILTGPNGSGKSSLLRVLAGFLPADAGDATLCGVSLRVDREAAQERVAYAGHLDAVKPQLTVWENLAVWARLFGAAGGAAERALAAFGLERLADTPAAYCSAGQKRRLGLARLLTAERPVWLLDEPTVSLDAAATENFARIVREHCAAGGLAVAATHAPLGFEGGPEIRLAPAPAAAAAADVGDPFLEGAW